MPHPLITAAAASLALVGPSDGELAMYVSIAERHWGQRIDCLQIRKTLEVRYADAEQGLPDWSHVGSTGLAPMVPGCLIRINPVAFARQPRSKRCGTVDHEFGHALGLPHARDGGPMDQLRDREIRACRRPAKGQPGAFERVRRH